MKQEQKKHEAIIWEPNKTECTLEDFFQAAKGLELDFIIYVQDSKGRNKSVWATSKEELVECLFTFSNKCYFGRIQSVDFAIQWGFFDESKDN